MYDNNTTSANMVWTTIKSGGTVIPPNPFGSCAGGYWDGLNGYWQWIPYTQPYIPPVTITHIPLSQKQNLAIEIIKAGLGESDPLTIAAREVLAQGLK